MFKLILKKKSDEYVGKIFSTDSGTQFIIIGSSDISDDPDRYLIKDVTRDDDDCFHFSLLGILSYINSGKYYWIN